MRTPHDGAPAPPTTPLVDVPPPVWPGRTDRGEIEVVDETLVWENPVVRVFDAAVRFPPHGAGAPVDGRLFRLVPAAHVPDGVVVAAVDEADGRLLLVRQFRHPLRRWMTECPRGAREDGETPEQAAARELREELGAEATAFVPLGRVAADSGQVGSVLWLLAARVRRAGRREAEPTEAIDRTVAMTYGALRAACERGELYDGLTLAVVLRLGPYARGGALALPWPDGA